MDLGLVSRIIQSALSDPVTWGGRDRRELRAWAVIELRRQGIDLDHYADLGQIAARCDQVAATQLVRAA